MNRFPVWHRLSAGERQVIRAGRMTYSALIVLFAIGSVCLLLGTVWRTLHSLTFVAVPNSVRTSSAKAEQTQEGIDPAALRIKSWHFLDDFPQEIAQFETVFWDPQDTASLREYLAASPNLKGGEVLEIGTGTGLIALFCAQRGAAKVLATDINPQAVANAGYNAALLGLSEKISVRLVPFDRPAPFTVIAEDALFDLIISNPPWEDAQVNEVAAAALYDPGFALLDGLLTDSAQHLKAGGKLLLAYGAKAAIGRIVDRAPAMGWHVKIHDARPLESLPEVFVPGILLELSRVSSLRE